MPLVSATARFHTNNDDKDDDTVLGVYLDGPMGRVAQIEGIRGHFDDHTDNGPFALQIIRPIARSEIMACRTRVHIAPSGHDTWRFNFELDLRFDEGLPYARAWNALSLDQNDRDFSDSLN